MNIPLHDYVVISLNPHYIPLITTLQQNVPFDTSNRPTGGYSAFLDRLATNLLAQVVECMWMEPKEFMSELLTLPVWHKLPPDEYARINTIENRTAIAHALRSAAYLIYFDSYHYLRNNLPTKQFSTGLVKIDFNSAIVLREMRPAASPLPLSAFSGGSTPIIWNQP